MLWVTIHEAEGYSSTHEVFVRDVRSVAYRERAETLRLCDYDPRWQALMFLKILLQIVALAVNSRRQVDLEFRRHAVVEVPSARYVKVCETVRLSGRDPRWQELVVLRVYVANRNNCRQWPQRAKGISKACGTGMTGARDVKIYKGVCCTSMGAETGC
jgi:hypothetical protein